MRVQEMAGLRGRKEESAEEEPLVEKSCEFACARERAGWEEHKGVPSPARAHDKILDEVDRALRWSGFE